MKQNRNLNLISDFVISEIVIRTPVFLLENPGVRCIKKHSLQNKNPSNFDFF